MKGFEWIGLLLVYGLFELVDPASLRTATAGEQRRETISFLWAFGALVGPERERKLVPITHAMTLKTGDQLKMLVELQNECFLYVIHHGAKGEVSLIFPYNLQQFTTDYRTQKRYDIPPGNAWFILDQHIGREAFYLMASAQRLTRLEKLLDSYAFADPEKKPGLTTQILAEIRQIQRRSRKFATLAERPVVIGGGVRSTSESEQTRQADIGTIATAISANDFFTRTFNIDHQ